MRRQTHEDEVNYQKSHSCQETEEKLEARKLYLSNQTSTGRQYSTFSGISYGLYSSKGKKKAKKNCTVLIHSFTTNVIIIGIMASLKGSKCILFSNVIKQTFFKNFPSLSLTCFSCHPRNVAAFQGSALSSLIPSLCILSSATFMALTCTFC